MYFMALCQLPQHCGICIDNKAAFTRNLFINRSTGRQTHHLNSFNRNFWGSSTTTENLSVSIFLLQVFPVTTFARPNVN